MSAGCASQHERLASFGVQCGCLGAYDRPSFLRWTPRAGMSMYVRVAAAGKLCGIGRVTKGGRLCTGMADEARNKIIQTAGCRAGREGGRGFESPFREAVRTARTARTASKDHASLSPRGGAG